MFFLSWRQLAERKKQSLLILLGISFGTMLFVSISGLQLGMRKYISEQLLNNTAHVLISGAERGVNPEEVTEAFYGSAGPVRWLVPPSGLRGVEQLQNYAGWYERLSRDPRVRDFSPRFSTHVVLANGQFTSSANLIGIIPERHLSTTSVSKYMQEGSFEELKGGGNIILGSGLAHDLGLRKGQILRVTSGEGGRSSFKVVGVVHFGNEQVDRTLAFANLTDVQILGRAPGRVNEIAVALFDVDSAGKVAKDWKTLTRDKVQDWQEANQAFMEMIRVQDFIRYFINISVLVVAAFGIYNVLTIMIGQKKKEIAILRAIGYGPPKILRLVLYQGLVLGFAGALTGLFLGWGLCRYIESIDLKIEIGGSNNLIVVYDWDIYVTAFVSALVSAILASYLPARAASEMTPMDIIRSE